MGYSAIASFGIAAVLTGAPAAQADPATPIGVIESSAAQLCAAVEADPTPDGVVAGMVRLNGRGLDEMDGAMVLVSAVHHVCPQYEDLVMGSLEPVAADEICPKSF